MNKLARMLSLRAKGGMKGIVVGILAMLVAQLSPAFAASPGPTTDLRGYGKVAATISPLRSEFICENEAKADILFGKLLADLFWDAGNKHQEQTVFIKGQEVVIHELPSYGSLAIVRHGSTVLAVGGANRQEVEDRLGKEKCLTGKIVSRPAAAYPRYLDFYDLRSASCGTLGAHPENKFRYQDSTDFVGKFFKGYNTGILYKETPAEGVIPFSMLDADFQAAEKEDKVVWCGVGTGWLANWSLDKWPEYVDRSRSFYDAAANTPPPALGMTPDQLAHSSFRFLDTVMRRYKDSPAIGAWELYCGQNWFESNFNKSVQSHLGYTAIGQESFRRWLKEVRKLNLPALGMRWYGDKAHFKSWSDVVLPDPYESFGGFSGDCLAMTDWFWRPAGEKDRDLPKDSETGWVAVKLPPAKDLFALPKTRAFWRCTFDAGDWLKKNAGQDVYLVCNDSGSGWGAPTTVWLNEKNLGSHFSKERPFFGPFSLNLTGQLQPGVNQLCLQIIGGEGRPIGPIFLTTTKPLCYPYLGKQGNARYLDCFEWRLQVHDSIELSAMKYARGIDPDRPLVVCATSFFSKNLQCAGVSRYGGSVQDTGYEASYRPLDSRLGYAGGYYGSMEPSGAHGTDKPELYAAYVPVMTRMLSWILINAEGSAKVAWRDPRHYIDFEDKTKWFTNSKRRIDLIGKYLPVKPEIAIFLSSQSALLGYEFHSFGNWDIGRGELPAGHYDNVYITEGMLAEGLADEYPVLFDTDTLIMGDDTIAALRRYVEKGGTFIALQNSGRHALLEADAWPISTLTGFKVLTVGKKGKIRFGQNLPVFKGWEGKEFEGEGNALDWREMQSATDVGVGLSPTADGTIPLARWEDGTVAVGMRTLGKGRVIVLGSTFWRNGRDIGGDGIWKTQGMEQMFFERLFTDLGVKRTSNATDKGVFTRKVITKNGLQEWLMAMNTNAAEMKVDLGFAAAEKPAAVFDVEENAPAPFTWENGWVTIKDAVIAGYGTRTFGVRRGDLSAGIDFWWFEKTKFWTRRAIVKPIEQLPADKESATNPATLPFEEWKFLADSDGSVGKTNDWMLPTFDDKAWRTSGNDAWNLKFPDLKEYGGVGLYRSRPFDLPSAWQGRKITLNTGWYFGGYCSKGVQYFLNGKKIGAFPRLTQTDVTALLQKEKNILSIEWTGVTGKNANGDYPLSGLYGDTFWLEPDRKLDPQISLTGDWSAIQGGWDKSDVVQLPGRVKGHHFTREFEVPISWKGKNVYLFLKQTTPAPKGGVGMENGMVVVNNQARKVFTLWNQRDATGVYVNLTVDLNYGEKNRIELWPQSSSSQLESPLKEYDFSLDTVEIGCETK